MTARTTGEAGRRGGDSPDSRNNTAAQSVDPVTQGLRQLFGAIEDEPVPDEFLRLLDAIDEQRAQGGRLQSSAEADSSKAT